MQKAAAFSFKNYRFSKVEINLDNFSEISEYNIIFNPKGVLNLGKQDFNLFLEFSAENVNSDHCFAKIICIATFRFSNPLSSVEDLPDYFYANALAIVFPYMRAFISNVTLMANFDFPVILPTLNLTGLQAKFKEQTKIISSDSE